MRKVTRFERSSERGLYISSNAPSSGDFVSVADIEMTQDEFNNLAGKIMVRQRELAANSNFHIKGFDKHRAATLIQAFAEEFGLVKIKST